VVLIPRKIAAVVEQGQSMTGVEEVWAFVVVGSVEC